MGPIEPLKRYILGPIESLKGNIGGPIKPLKEGNCRALVPSFPRKNQGQIAGWGGPPVAPPHGTEALVQAGGLAAVWGLGFGV